MTETQLKCPKCDGALVQGFVLDHTYGGRVLPDWYEGLPKQAFWAGISRPPADGIPLAAFRCSACGYVEFYALEIFKAV